MLFSSSVFLFLFLPLVIMGYYLLKNSFRLYFLLFSSLLFYAWGEPKYILVMLFSIAINYVFGLVVGTEKSPQVKKAGLLLAIVCNLGILFYFKYLNFALTNANWLFRTDFVYHNIIMPIGISFFTFQGISYIIDIYLGKIKAQRNLAIVAFYISFFPQLTAGPIVRYIDIEAQLYKRTESFEKFFHGAQRFCIGLTKKMVIANTVGYTADQIFATSLGGGSTVATAWLGIICYSFQIYFDFSGYSDMAIGLGKMFGFDFLENFNYPYISKTITEFWRRWHISLSSWFKDYVYIPLGGNRKGNIYVNLGIVFILTGLWHGASFNFLVWGLWHGAFLVAERAFKLTDVKEKALVPLRYATTMLVVVIGWVFFRADTLTGALKYIISMFGARDIFVTLGLAQPRMNGLSVMYYLDTKIICVLIVAVFASMPLSKIQALSNLQSSSAWKYISAVLTLGLLFISSAFVVSSSYNPFIYFRF